MLQSVKNKVASMVTSIRKKSVLHVKPDHLILKFWDLNLELVKHISLRASCSSSSVDIVLLKIEKHHVYAPVSATSDQTKNMLT